MHIILFAVLLVMAVLNIFLVFIIRQIVLITNRQVQRHFTVEMDAMAGELDEVMGRLAQAKKELVAEEAGQKEAEGLRAPGQPAAQLSLSAVAGFRHPRYRSEESLETYRYIRDHLKLDYKELIRKGQEHCPIPDRTWECCRTIQEKVGFEQMYHLILLPEDRQAQYLQELLTEEELAVLEQVAPEEWNADISVRMDEVRQYVRLHDPRLRVECGDPEGLGEEFGDVQVEYNPQIHEGIRLHIGSEVLDYSL